jgi:hypothetical protein
MSPPFSTHATPAKRLREPNLHRALHFENSSPIRPSGDDVDRAGWNRQVGDEYAPRRLDMACRREMSCLGGS